MSIPILVDGIDPGADGAAVRLSSEGRAVRVVAAVSWTKNSRGFHVAAWTPEYVQHRRSVTPHARVTEALWPQAPHAVVTEEVFVGRNARGALKLARYAQAEIDGCLLSWPRGVVERRILENHWRKTLGLRPSRKGRPDPVPEMMTGLIQGIEDVVRALGAPPHLFDACALAYLGHKKQAWEDGWSSRVETSGRAVRAS